MALSRDNLEQIWSQYTSLFPLLQTFHKSILSPRAGHPKQTHSQEVANQSVLWSLSLCPSCLMSSGESRLERSVGPGVDAGQERNKQRRRKRQEGEEEAGWGCSGEVNRGLEDYSDPPSSQSGDGASPVGTPAFPPRCSPL